VKKTQKTKEKDKKSVQPKPRNEANADPGFAGWDDIPPTRKTTNKTRCDGW
jgi:hypothetical protein